MGMGGMGNMNGMGMGMGMNMNTGLYVPKSEGTSIASIMQNKKQGRQNIGMNTSIGMGMGSAAGMVRPPPTDIDSRYGYGVDSNGYPITAQHAAQHSAPSDTQTMSSDRYSHSQAQASSRSHPSSQSHNYNDDAEYSKIMELANDVSNSLEILEQKEKQKKKKNRSRTLDTKDDDNDDDDDGDGGNDDDENTENAAGSGKDAEQKELAKNASDRDITGYDDDYNYGMIIIEPLLLLTIYVVLSQDFMIDFASRYIEQLNPVNGGIPLSGIIIWGIVLVILFMSLRKIVQYKL